MPRKPKAPRRRPEKPPIPFPPFPPADPVPDDPQTPSPASTGGAGGADELAALADAFRAEDAAGAAPEGTTAGTAPDSIAAPAPAPVPMFDGRDFGGRMAAVAFDLIAARYGKHWQLTSAERAALADALAPLMNRMATKVEGVWMEAAVATVVLTSIVYPRLMASAEQAAAAAAHLNPAPAT